jgi:hypothetical protein
MVIGMLSNAFSTCLVWLYLSPQMRIYSFWDIVRLSKRGADMKQRVLILGHGKMGHALECLVSGRHDVRIWCMEKEGDATLEDMVA